MLLARADVAALHGPRGNHPHSCETRISYRDPSPPLGVRRPRDARSPCAQSPTRLPRPRRSPGASPGVSSKERTARRASRTTIRRSTPAADVHDQSLIPRLERAVNSAIIWSAVLVIDKLYEGRDYPRFYALETVARVAVLFIPLRAAPVRDARVSGDARTTSRCTSRRP